MANSEYNHKEIEKKWQDKWQADGVYKVADKVAGKENFYTLVEFAYPSGNLHVGHWYAFAIPDMYARYKRMQGFNVLYPMGFDAFGLPAENAAIKLGKDPKTWTYEHMDKMREQFYSMGTMFDWSREVVTCDPGYYKWTQWMFNEFLKKDLVYRATTQVNWCPKDQTVLANEQVVNGCCERCGAEVIQKDQDQWMFRITKYADRLIDDLNTLDWPEHIKEAQRNWIGKSEGSEIGFRLKVIGNSEMNETIKVFTTRADTLFGVTYIVVSPEHALVSDLKSNISNWGEVEKYISETKKKSDLDRQQSKEKNGVRLEGIFAINPANGEEVPVWIADYVLAGYGTGAVMAVPAHDERDFEFAEKYNLPIKSVIKPILGGDTKDSEKNLQFIHDIMAGKVCYTGNGLLTNSQQFDLQSNEKVIQKITEFVGGKMVSTYRLRDWGISRQRYWGCPIPIVYDPQGKAHAVPDEHLPWLLPKDVDHTPDGTAPLARSVELKNRVTEIFGAGWTPEVETMDTFVDSSWYFYRYLDNKNEREFATKEKMDAWMPIQMYFGGAEHTTMHLLYSRFWVKAMHDCGMVKEIEPYIGRRNRGLILGPDGNKMSKSKGNVIDPDEVVTRLGADTVRLYLAFMGPYGDGGNYPWDPNGVVGVRRFLERVWRLSEKLIGDNKQSTEIANRVLHKTIKKITEDIAEYKFNTCISTMMICLNEMEKEAIAKDDFKMFLKILAPFAPHIAEEIWHEMGDPSTSSGQGQTSIHLSDWPTFDASKIVETEITIAVQVAGKVRAEFTIPADMGEEEIKEKALEHEGVKKWTEGKTIARVIYVKNKLVNIVIS